MELKFNHLVTSQGESHDVKYDIVSKANECMWATQDGMLAQDVVNECIDEKLVGESTQNMWPSKPKTKYPKVHYSVRILFSFLS